MELEKIISNYNGWKLDYDNICVSLKYIKETIDDDGKIHKHSFQYPLTLEIFNDDKMADKINISITRLLSDVVQNNGIRFSNVQDAKLYFEKGIVKQPELSLVQRILNYIRGK
jgi:hypothetical protein